ncbi:MAG TPA: cation-transporting P-type ATPase, partial [Methanothrix sp.]|nr:cation-transporting P-type ATPase [Methanothrix sp.]
MPSDLSAFWSLAVEDLQKELDVDQEGLTDEEARLRLKKYGSNLLRQRKDTATVFLFLAQFKSPIILLLVFAASLSIYLGQATDALIILIIILISGVLGFWQERGAADAVSRLLAIVQIRATVMRNGKAQEIPIEEVVPGDIVLLNAGDIIPGDCRILK